MRLSDYTPFFVPEFGWVVIVLTLAALISEFNGSAERYMRKNFLPSAPFRLLRVVAIGAFLCGFPMGIGILLQFEGMAKVGLWTSVALVTAFWLIGQKYRSGKRESGRRP